MPTLIRGWKMTAPSSAPPGAHRVLVEVAGCGICHTDLGFLYGGVAPKQPLPLVLGHEVAGVVIDAAPGLGHWLGRRVIVPAVSPCGRCAFCAAGRPTSCRAALMPGNDEDGGFATHVEVPGATLCAVDPPGGDVGRLGEAPKHRLAPRSVHDLGGKRAREPREDHAGRHGVDRDALGAELARGGLRQADEPGLCRGVVACPNFPRMALMLLMFTMRPRRAAAIRAPSSRSTQNAPVRFTSSTSGHSASDILSNERSRVMPALLTSRDVSGGSAATPARTCAGSATSTR